MAVMEDSKVLIGETANGRLYVYLDEYRSNVVLHIRYWYLCKKENIYKPGFKGIAIPVASIKPILEAIALILPMVPTDD